MCVTLDPTDKFYKRTKMNKWIYLLKYLIPTLWRNMLKHKYLLIIFILLFPVLSNAELVIQGKRTIYTGNAIQSGITITESEVAPTNPALNDVWRNITDGTIYTWNGTIWEVKNKTQEIKDEIVIFKKNIESVSDPAVKKCLKALKRMVFQLYKEQ